MTQFDAIGPFSGQWYTQNKMGRSSNSCQISDTIGAKNPRLKGAEFSYFILSLAPGLSQKGSILKTTTLGHFWPTDNRTDDILILIILARL